MLSADCGTIIDETVSCSHVFITHGHLDHIGGCIAHARAKQLTGITCPHAVPSVSYCIPIDYCACIDNLSCRPIPNPIARGTGSLLRP